MNRLYTGRNQCLKVIKKLYVLIMSYWRYEYKNRTVTSIVELVMECSLYSQR